MTDTSRNTLKKQERLSSKSGLSGLFSGGKYGSCNGIKYCYRTGNSLPYNRIVVSVPKRLFKRAVKRNLLKRRIREAYRISKNILPIYSSEKGGTDILFSYTVQEVRNYTDILANIQEILSLVSSRINDSGKAGETDGQMSDNTA